MFRSFFPMPKIFFPSAIIWIILSTIIWFWIGTDIAKIVGFNINEDAEPIIGLGYFISQKFIWFYLYYLIATIIFAGFWFRYSPHKWQNWSILGSSLIIFSTYFGVQVAVAINNWRRPFFDAIQNALGNEITVYSEDLYILLFIFAQIAFVSLAVFVLTRFFVSHYIFRWRTAMNFYYTDQWSKLRSIEGAAQRVQEDTMRFAAIMEGLGVSIIDAVMTLIAFTPILWGLSKSITVLPWIGEVDHALVWVAIISALGGTFILASVGIKLPGIEYDIQKEEAAYRKELVLGEDFKENAQPAKIENLYGGVRKIHYKMYFHYLYFNAVKWSYLQGMVIVPYLALAPTIVTGAITLGFVQQIIRAFGRVETSLQYLVRSWPIIVELISVWKRLTEFENKLKINTEEKSTEKI